MSDGYTRQSAATIVTGATILASGLNAEYNQLVSAFSGATGHDHTGGTGLGPQLTVAALVTLSSSTAGLIAANGANSFNARTITGTSNVIAVTNGTGASGNPTINIDPAYVGQTSITTLGTITTGTWTGTAVAVANGGTGSTSASAARTALGLGTLATQNGTFSGTSSGTNTGDQTITLTGGVTGSGTGSFAATVITNANLTGVITSVGNATSIASQTGTGTKFVVDTSPTLITPILGVAAATSINKVAITAPATSSTLTVADGKTLTCSNTLTFTGTDSSSVAFGAGGTVVYTTVTSLGSLTSAAALATVGTITSGTWTGTTIAVANGGTGVTTSTGSGNNVLSASPTFTGTPLAPTAVAGTNNTQIATTAFATALAAAAVSGTDTTFTVNGYIIKFGVVTGATPGTGNQTVNFATAFPTACSGAITCLNRTTSGSGDTGYVTVKTVSTSAITFVYTENRYWVAWGN